MPGWRPVSCCMRLRGGGDRLWALGSGLWGKSQAIHGSGIPPLRTERARMGHPAFLMSLFQTIPGGNNPADETRPLADRMRPRTLDEYVGQEPLVWPGKPVRTPV